MSVLNLGHKPLVARPRVLDRGLVESAGPTGITMLPRADRLEQELIRIEFALERGDIGDARHALAQARRALCPEAPPTRERLRVVGGVELTDREGATLRRLTDGSMSQKDIARDLDVSHNTVKTHLKSIYQKLGVHCRGEAIKRARELGLLPAPLAPPVALSPLPDRAPA